MKPITIHKRSIGFSFHAGEWKGMVWAPEARSVDVEIIGKARMPLQKDIQGYWQFTSALPEKGDHYLLILDEEKKLPDPASLSQPNGIHEASELIAPELFLWEDHAWCNPPLDEYIIYELHTGVFTPSGTFHALGEKLDHLKSLGITAIELMPVAAFPGNRNWGYDGVFPFAVQASYGGAEKLQELVSLCHEKGIAVILDVVYNHLGPEGNCLGEYGPYFTDKYKTPWGHAVNFDDAGCDAVRHYFIENALMWLRDFHIDALRLDAVHAIRDFGAKHFLAELRHYVDELSAYTGKTYYLIAECDLNDPKYIEPAVEKGYGMNAQWLDEFHHALRVCTGQKQEGYYADFSGIEHLAKSYSDAYVYDGQYSEHRRKSFGSKAEGRPGEQFIVFSQNHDQVGNRMLGERTSRLLSFEMRKLVAGAVMVSPYLPLLFMGEEWSEPNPFLYFVSHTDSDLAESVRKGRREEFKAFPVTEEVPDPMTSETYEQSRLQWFLADNEPHATMLAFYKALIDFRKRCLPLSRFRRSQVEVSCDTATKTLVLHRWCGDDDVMCYLNFSGEKRRVVLPAFAPLWRKQLDSADQRWGGHSELPEEASGGAEMLQQPESILLFTAHV